MRTLLRRAFPYALLVAAAIVAAWPILRGRGMPYNVDISGFFPLTPDAYQGRFWPLWNERGGMSTLQFLPALAFELPLLLVGDVMHWGMDIHLKVRVVLGFALAGIAMFALARHYVAKRFPRAPASVLLLAPLAAALLYMLNPWSVHRIFHYFLWIGYAMAPLVVLAFERLVDSPTWKRALVFAAAMTLASTDPHNPALLSILLAPIAIMRLAPLLVRDRSAAMRLVRSVALAIGAYVAFAAYWILPYAFNVIKNPGFGPTYVLSDEMLDTLSRHGSFLESARFLNNYLPRGDLWPVAGTGYQIWLVASFAVPVLAFLALLVERSRVAWTYGLLAASTLILGMGTQGPLPGAYHWLIFGAPWGEGLSWLFRDPYRWGGIQALAYGVLLALSVAAIGTRLARIRIPAAAPAIAIAAALLFSAPALASYTTGAYAPLEIPHEYGAANAALAASPADASVVWMPRMLGSTTWSGDRTMEYFDATSSARPALGPFRPLTSAYFDFLQDAIKDGADVAPLLARAGADRIVYHNDVNVESGARTIQQISTLGLAQTARLGDSPTLAIDQSSVAPTYTSAAKLQVYGTREADQTFVANATDLAQLTLRVTRVGEPGPMRVSIERADDAALVFSRNVTVPSSARDVDVPLNGLHLAPGSSYLLRVAAGAPSGPDDRYDLSYYRVDTYAAGALAGTSGDLSFELFAHTRGFAVELVSPAPAPRVRLAQTALASPADLQLLRALDTLPADGALRNAPVLFLDADPSARAAFSTSASANTSWGWIAAFDESSVAPIVPFLPASSFVKVFGTTSNADLKDGWARGTQDFTYYDTGWKRALGAAGDESWGFDGSDGLVYASLPATLYVSVAPLDSPGVLLARVFVSPDGGALAFHADGAHGAASVGEINTSAARARLEWVKVGDVPAGATRLVIRNGHSLQGIDALVVTTQAAFAAAENMSTARMASVSTTLVAQAETIPLLAARTVALPGVGRVVDITSAVTVPTSVPAPGEYTLWLRMPAGAPAPILTFDGAPLDAPQCAAQCSGPAAWSAVHIGRIEAGAHALGIANASGTTARIDVLALSSDASFAARADPAVGWTRVSATEYKAHVESGGLLAFAAPFDAGWIARVDGKTVRAVPVDGVANGFMIPPGAHDITIAYEPQAWAQLGLMVSLVAAFSSWSLASVAVLRRRFGATDPIQEAFR